MNKIKKTLLIIFVVIISGFFGYRFGLSQSGNFLKSIVEPGSMITEASYVIFTDGTYYYARNGNTGEIEFQSNNASYVIQSAINALTSGQKIFLKNSTYTLNTSIIVEKAIAIEGEGKNTILEGSVNPLLKIDGSTTWFEHFGIRNIQLKQTSDSSDGLLIKNADFGLIEGLITNGGRSGIVLEESIGNTFIKPIVWNAKYVYSSGIPEGAGVFFKGSTSKYSNLNKFFGGRISGSDGDAVTGYRASKNVFSGMSIEANKVAFRLFFDMVGWTISDGWLESNSEANVIISDTTSYGLVLSKNIISIPSGGKGIVNDGKAAPLIIEQNIFSGSGSPYIEIPSGISSPNKIVIKENQGLISTKISDASGVKYVRNPDFATENSGDTTIANNEWIAHELATTPTIVTLTPRSNVNVWVNDRNATHFQVGVSSGIVTVDWHAEV